MAMPTGGLRTRTVLLALLALGSLAWVNATRGLNEPDEARYAVIALHMADGSASWWVPEMSGLVHADKPPLVYWASAIAMRAFGPVEWAMRLPSLVGAVLAMTGLWWLATQRAGREAALWSVLVCAGSLQFWGMSAILSPDMLMTGFTTLAAGAWARSAGARGKAAAAWWVLACLAWVGAWWTKATPALLLLAVLAASLAVVRDRHGLRRLRPLTTAALVLLAGAPWYVDMVQRFPELLRFFVGSELIGRVVGHPDGREGPVYYYLGLAVLAWLPWWLLPGVRWREVARAAPLEGTVVLLGVLAFTVISSKLPSYLLPLLPWGALLIGRVLAASMPDRPPAGAPVAAVGLAASMLVCVAAVLVLRYAGSSLGSQSTMQQVGASLRAERAGAVISDHYRPGLEIYFGPQVFHLSDRSRAEVLRDLAPAPASRRPAFVSSTALRAGMRPARDPGLWVVTRADRTAPAVAELLERRGARRQIRVGDFLLVELR